VEFWAFFARIAWALGVAHALDGNVADALPLLEQAVAHTSSTRFRSGSSVLLADLSEGYLLAGRLDDARRTGQEALALARELGEAGNEAIARRALGAMLTRRDPPDVAGAETYFGQALVLAEGLSMRPLAARCHLSLGALYRRAGHPDPARAELALAADAFRALGMASWLTRAEAELGQLDPAASAGTSLPTGVVESLGADAHAHAGSREDAGGASEDRSDQHGVPSR
jgi:tetratricopeptide (TPR) repeat protein